MTKKNEQPNNNFIADRAGVINGKFVHVIVGARFTTILSGTNKGRFEAGTRVYKGAKQWVKKG